MVSGVFWTPKKIKGDFNGFKAHVLAQDCADERIRLVSAVLSKINGFSDSLHNRLRTLRLFLDSSEGGTKPLGSETPRSMRGKGVAGMVTPSSRGNKWRDRRSTAGGPSL